MRIKQYEIWMADLNPRFGTETGKTRPVVILQTNLLNGVHFSTIICPLTTQVNPDAEILRVHLYKKNSKLKDNSDILIDQVRAIDNRRLIKKIGQLSLAEIKSVRESLAIILDL